jgi:hypothetical protein
MCETYMKTVILNLGERNGKELSAKYWPALVTLLHEEPLWPLSRYYSVLKKNKKPLRTGAETGARNCGKFQIRVRGN